MSQAIRMLLAEGRITSDQFDNATATRTREGGTVGQHLVTSGAITADDLLHFLVRRFPLKYLTRNQIKAVPSNVISFLPGNIAAKFRVLPIKFENNNLSLGITDPSENRTLQQVAHHTKCQVFNPILISEQDMNWALNRYYGIALATEVARPQKKMGVAAQAVVRTPIVISEPKKTKAQGPKPTKQSGKTTDADQLQAEASETGWSLDGASAEQQERSAALDREWAFPSDRQKEKEKKPESQKQQARSSSSVPAKQRRRTGRLLPIRPESKPPIRLLSKPAPPPAQEKVPLSKPRRTTAERAAPKIDDSRTATDSWQTPPQEALPQRRVSFPGSRGRPKVSQPKPEPKPKKPSSGELLHQISTASKRDEIIKGALEFLIHYAERSIFFVVQENRIKGHAVAGEATSGEAVRALWIPANSASTLREVISDRQIHFGELGKSPADKVLASALGGKPDRALIVPVMIRNRVIGLLYADKLSADPLPWEQVERLTDVIGAAFTNLLKQGGR